MRSLWGLGGLSWWQLALRVWRQGWKDELPGRCAELAYYFLFASFPLLLFLTSLLGYLAGGNPALRASLFDYLANISPSPQVTALLHNTLDQILRARGGARISLSLVVALWVASSGVLALTRTLNTTCGVKETRSWWKRRLQAVVLTITFSALLIAALALIFYGAGIGEALAGRLGLHSAFVFAWRFLHLPLLLAAVLLSFEIVYNYAPDLDLRARRRWGTPGAVIGVALWLAASFGLRLYLAESGSHTITYGSLGAVILLMVWFYLTAFSLLVGAEINSEIERQIAQARPARASRPAATAARSRRRRR
jgi:membrane protein